jgi:hypothetical protein
MAEAAQGAALLVKPADVTTLADALLIVVEGGRTSAAVSERCALGVRLAASHTWEASAGRHLEAYTMARTASQ